MSGRRRSRNSVDDGLPKASPAELLRTLRWVASTFWRPEAGPLAGLTLVQVVLAVAAGLQPRAMGGLVEGITSGRAVWGWAVFLIVVLALPRLARVPDQLAHTRMQRRLTARVDEVLIGAGEAMPDLGLLDRRDFRDDADRQYGWGAALPGLAEQLTAVVRSLTTTLVLVAAVAPLGWWLPIPLLVVAGVGIVLTLRAENLTFAATWEASVDTKEMWYCVSSGTHPDNVREVRVFGLADHFERRHQRHFDQAMATMTRARRRHLWRWVGLSVISALAVAASLWFSRDGLTAASATVLITSIIALAQSFTSHAMAWGSAYGSLRELSDMAGFLQRARPTIEVADPGVEPPARYAQGLTLRDVHFRYDDDNPVLTGLDLHVPAGKVLALVGENGEGKSTLVRLLTRLNDPDSGTIELDGRPFSDYKLTRLRDGMAAVFQDHAHFAFRVYETVALGQPELLTEPDSPRFRARIEQALVDAGADRIVAENGGLDEQLGLNFGGVEFSGGEWQRLSTARAFLPDAALVVLDEPTSAIDADAERRLFDQFTQLVAGRTAVIISHRFSTVRKADVIAVMKDGRIVESGSHDELMAAAGHYAELFTIQASRYV